MSVEKLGQQQTRLFNERFAAAQLGHSQAAVRLVGVYGLAVVAAQRNLSLPGH